MDKLNIVGHSYPQIDAFEKTMGKTRFVSDLVLPGMLHGRTLRSPYPHARILHIDTSVAKALTGVKAVASYADTPGIKYGPRSEDWTIFAADKARFYGEEVAAVAAVDRDTAEEALDLIKVEYEELPGVFDPVEAMQEGAPLVHEASARNIAAEFSVDVGDVDRAFDQSAAVYQDSYYTNQVYQGYLEPMGAVADVDLSGRITMWAGCQIPNMARLTYAKALGISPDSIRMVVPDYGGGFGGKFENNVHLIAAVLAQKAGKPVRLMNTRYDDFVSGNPRVPMYIDIKLGATSEGILTGKEVRIVGGSGAPVVGVGIYKAPTVMPDPKSKYGNISPAYPFGCHIAEVEVDPQTGQVTVTHFTAAHDVGRAINPLATEGQIQGGVAQGLGWTLTENMVTDNGILKNPDFVDYVMPTTRDVPEIKPILVEPHEPNGPYGAKGIGEPALNPAMSAVTNAIYHAIGLRIKELPIAPEKILAHLKAHKE